MSINRWNAKTDDAQADIVTKLEEAGVRVWVIKQPCDLLCLVQGRWRTLEVKTPYTKSGKPKKRKDQKEQEEFLKSTCTPVVTNIGEALVALGIISGASPKPQSISATCKSKHPGTSTSSVGGR